MMSGSRIRGSSRSRISTKILKNCPLRQTHAHLRLLTSIIPLSVLACDFIMRNEQMRRRNFIRGFQRSVRTARAGFIFKRARNCDYFFDGGDLTSMRGSAPCCAFIVFQGLTPQVEPCPDP